MNVKIQDLKRIFWICAVFLGGVCVKPALAHDLFGKTLGVPFFATDVYRIQCSTDSAGATDYLEVNVVDATKTGGGGSVSAVIRGPSLVSQTTDMARNDGKYSPPQKVRGGNAIYDVIVHKNGAGQKVYSLKYHCKTSNGGHSGTELLTIQNQ